jgi:hypothetical protein
VSKKVVSVASSPEDLARKIARNIRAFPVPRGSGMSLAFVRKQQLRNACRYTIALEEVMPLY